MQLETFKFIEKNGWSLPKLPNLDSKNTLVLTFCSPRYFNNTKPFEELRKAYPNAQFAGCSTAGEIYHEEVNDNSISVAVAKFDKTDIKVVNERVLKNSDSFQAGQNIAEKLANDQLKGVLIFSDGLNVNGSALVEGLKRNLPPSVIITGGLAGDGKNFKQTWVLDNITPSIQKIIAVGFYGDNVEIGFGSKGGWDLFGPERLITKSNGNVLYEIDGQPALVLYKKYLGDRADGLPATALLFPLSLGETISSKNKVVRTILSVNESDQSMTFAGDITQGWYAQLMKANFDRLIEGASLAGKLAMESQHSNGNNLAIAISCVGRRLVLGERTEEEIEATIDSLDTQSQLVGFYSYGEISPSGLSNCDLHNQTMTLTTISEK